MTEPSDVPEFGQPDNRAAAEREADDLRAANQLTHALRHWSDLGSRRRILELLRDRRNENPEREGEPVEIVDTEDGREILVMRHELLTTRDALEDDEGLRGLLGELGWVESSAREDEACLEQRFARFVWTGEDAAETSEEIDRVRARTRHRVSPNYVIPYGAVMKGGETPEETSSTTPIRPPQGDQDSVPVAVVDTGLAFQMRTDRWIVDLIDESEEDQLDVIPPSPGGDGYLDVGAGHGSFVAGIIQQIVPDAPIKVYQVLDTDGLATELQVACAMVRAVSEMLEEGGRLVVNLSLGTDTIDDQPLLVLQSALDVIDDLQAERRGEVLIVAAAGNSSDAHPHWPAAFDRVVAVGALNQDGTPADFSTRGTWVDCSTVGVGIRSTYVEGEELPELDAPEPHETWGADAWAQWLGTSFAAPQVAGAVAKLAHENDWSLRLSLQTLLSGRPRVHGFGRVRRIL